VQAPALATPPVTLAPATTERAAAAALEAVDRGTSGGTLRAVLLGLAAAAAGGLTLGHVGAFRSTRA
jgi:hypothetical protein